MSQLLHKVKEAKAIAMEEGPRALYRKYGWKFITAVFFYYLIRDLSLYVFLPMILGINLIF